MCAFFSLSVQNVLQSHLTPPEVEGRLLSVVEPRETLRKWFSVPKNQKLFEGKVGELQFEVRRIIDYRNDFLPSILGRILPTSTGSRVELDFRVPDALLIGIITWLLITGIGGILLVTFHLSKGTIELFSFVPLLMFIFGLVAPIISFKSEVARSTLLLKNVIA